jgi:GTPase
MSIARERCCLMLSLAIPHAVELSVWTGVAGCGYPISSKVVRRMVALLQFSNRAPISASDADDSTGFMMLVVASIVPLPVSSFVSLLPI